MFRANDKFTIKRTKDEAYSPYGEVVQYMLKKSNKSVDELAKVFGFDKPKLDRVLVAAYWNGRKIPDDSHERIVDYLRNVCGYNKYAIHELDLLKRFCSAEFVFNKDEPSKLISFLKKYDRVEYRYAR